MRKFGGKQSEIDYFMARKCAASDINDCKVLPAESEITQQVKQHKLLVMDCRFNIRPKKRTQKRKFKKIKWWKLHSNDPDTRKDVDRFASTVQMKLEKSTAAPRINCGKYCMKLSQMLRKHV